MADQQTETDQDKPAPLLRDELTELMKATYPDQQGDRSSPIAESAMREAFRNQADAVLHLLNERGHYLPGCPPAAQILQDAQQFAGQFMLAMLCVRLLRMLDTGIVTPETKGMKRWLLEYIDGKHHGPVGKPMLWPGGLPGVAEQMRGWGYAPTPTHPAFVTRARPEHMMTLQ